MNPNALRKLLETWQAAGLLDAGTAGRIHDYEQSRRDDGGTSLAQILALGIGGLLLTAGILLFVAAHWDELSPASRFLLVLALVFAAHGAAVWRRSPPALPVVLHAIGTGFFGAGIFLAGQIFNLQAHWPAAFMLWAAGAGAGWWLLRQWPQGVWLAVLAPLWLGGEYVERVGDLHQLGSPLWGGLLVLALSYLTLDSAADPILRRALRWAGWICAIPFASLALQSDVWERSSGLSSGPGLLGWLLCLSVPMAADLVIRRRFEWRLALFDVGAWLLSTTSGGAGGSLTSEFWHHFGGYLIAGAMALAMTWWGVIAKKAERLNLGVLAFGIVVITYYFSNVMDKLNRSLSLLSLGILFFVLAYALGKIRRRLLAEIQVPPGGAS